MKKATSLDVYNIALFNSNQKAQMISDLETLKGLKKAITNEENKLKDRAIRLNKAHYVVTKQNISAKEAYTRTTNTFAFKD